MAGCRTIPTCRPSSDALDAAGARTADGSTPVVVILDEAVHTAAAAAEALGVEVGQIANSLIFDADGEPLLVLTSGAHRVDTAKVAALLGRRAAARGPPRSSSASTPARRSAASRRSATPSRSAPWSTRRSSSTTRSGPPAGSRRRSSRSRTPSWCASPPARPAEVA